MKLSIFFSSVLFVSGALAFPHADSRLARRVANRQRKSRPFDGLESLVADTNVTHPEYSSNWAGAVITSPPSGQTFNRVVGTFTVPSPSVPSGSSSRGTYSGSAWVGIDGDTYSAAILQSGIDFTIDDGEVSFDAWYEWYPNFAFDFSGFSVSAGNQIQVTIAASSPTRGTVTLDNLSTGRSVSETLSAPSSSASLGGQNAEWIVEDFESGGSLVEFADFSAVTFTGCSASTSSSSEGVSGATIIDIEQGSDILTDVTIVSSSSVKVAHT